MHLKESIERFITVAVIQNISKQKNFVRVFIQYSIILIDHVKALDIEIHNGCFNLQSLAYQSCYSFENYPSWYSLDVLLSNVINRLIKPGRILRRHNFHSQFQPQQMSVFSKSKRRLKISLF